jgi:hypothetical protein
MVHDDIRLILLQGGLSAVVSFAERFEGLRGFILNLIVRMLEIGDQLLNQLIA